MSILGKQDLAVLVLRDADEIATAVLGALETASLEERPGLERALTLIIDAAGVPDAELRTRWVRQQFEEAGYEGPAHTVEAIRTLRQAHPGLSLLQAVRLTKEAAVAAS